MTTSEFVKRSIKVHGTRYDYSKSICQKAITPIVITCTDHGDFHQQPRHHINGSGCPKCTNRSSLERKTIEVLQKIAEPFTEQKIFNDCRGISRPLPFDFHLPRLNVLIECDGQQHFKPIDIFGGEKSFDVLQHNDQLKDKYCEENGIHLIRIPYWVKNIELYLTDALILK